MHVKKIAVFGRLLSLAAGEPVLALRPALVHSRCDNETLPPYPYSFSTGLGGPTGTGSGTFPTGTGSGTFPTATGSLDPTASSSVYSFTNSSLVPISTGTTSPISNSSTSAAGTSGKPSYPPYSFTFPTLTPTITSGSPSYPTGGSSGSIGPISTGTSPTPPYGNSSTIFDPTGSSYTYSFLTSGTRASGISTSLTSTIYNTTLTINSTQTISSTFTSSSTITTPFPVSNTTTLSPVTGTSSFTTNLTSSTDPGNKTKTPVYPTYPTWSYPIWSLTTSSGLYPSSGSGTVPFPTVGTGTIGSVTSIPTFPTGTSVTYSFDPSTMTKNITSTSATASATESSSSTESSESTSSTTETTEAPYSYSWISSFTTSTKFTPTYSTKSMPSEYYYHHRRPHKGQHDHPEGPPDFDNDA